MPQDLLCVLGWQAKPAIGKITQYLESIIGMTGSNKPASSTDDVPGKCALVAEEMSLHSKK